MSRSSWDRNAPEWARRAAAGLDASREHLVFPAVVSLFQDTHARTVLDVGCGSGSVGTLLMGQQQAVRIVGVDWSLPMCRAAGAAWGAAQPVVCGDVTRLPFRERSFDVAVANMLLSGVDDIAGCFRELARVLVSGGHLIFSLLHPARVIPAEVGSDGVREVFQYDHERSVRARVRLGGPGWLPKTVSYQHRMLSTYAGALRDSGFVTVDIREPTGASVSTGRFPHMRRFWSLAPFVVWLAERR